MFKPSLPAYSSSVTLDPTGDLGLPAVRVRRGVTVFDPTGTPSAAALQSARDEAELLLAKSAGRIRQAYSALVQNMALSMGDVSAQFRRIGPNLTIMVRNNHGQQIVDIQVTATVVPEESLDEVDKILKTLPDLWLQIDTRDTYPSVKTVDSLTINAISPLYLGEIKIEFGAKKAGTDNRATYGLPFWGFDEITSEGLLTAHPNNVYYKFGETYTFAENQFPDYTTIYSRVPDDVKKWLYIKDDYTASPAMNDYHNSAGLEGNRASEFEALSIPIPDFVGNWTFLRQVFHIGKLMRIPSIITDLTLDRITNALFPLRVSIKAHDAALAITTPGSSESFSQIVANWQLKWGTGKAVNLGPQVWNPRPPYGVEFKKVISTLTGQMPLPRGKTWAYLNQTRETGVSTEICRAEFTPFGGKKVVG